MGRTLPAYRWRTKTYNDQYQIAWKQMKLPKSSIESMNHFLNIYSQAGSTTPVFDTEMIMQFMLIVGLYERIDDLKKKIEDFQNYR